MSFLSLESQIVSSISEKRRMYQVTSEMLQLETGPPVVFTETLPLSATVDVIAMVLLNYLLPMAERLHPKTVHPSRGTVGMISPMGQLQGKWSGSIYHNLMPLLNSIKPLTPLLTRECGTFPSNLLVQRNWILFSLAAECPASHDINAQICNRTNLSKNLVI